MTNVADRMLELLLSPLSDFGWVVLFHELETKGTPLSRAITGSVKRTGRQLVLYTSKELGVSLYGEDEGWIMTIHFAVGSSFIGDLPFGLRPDYRIGDVDRLIGPATEPPVVVERCPEFGISKYSFDSYRVVVWYYLADELLHEIRVMRTADA